MNQIEIVEEFMAGNFDSCRSLGHLSYEKEDVNTHKLMYENTLIAKSYLNSNYERKYAVRYETSTWDKRDSISVAAGRFCRDKNGYLISLDDLDSEYKSGSLVIHDGDRIGKLKIEYNNRFSISDCLKYSSGSVVAETIRSPYSLYVSDTVPATYTQIDEYEAAKRWMQVNEKIVSNTATQSASLDDDGFEEF